MEDRVVETLFRIFEEKMAEMCSVVPSDHSKSIVSQDWFSYIDSLGPAVETIRPSEELRGRGVTVRKSGNVPALALLAGRINKGPFDRILIEDPGISPSHIPTWGPNLLLVDRDFAERVIFMGCLP